MGGNAFNGLGDNAFPRMPTSAYVRRKSIIQGKLATLFEFVGTPRERPNKLDHGDIDFVVCNPFDAGTTPERVKSTIEAEHLVKSAAAKGLGTSNYALLADENDKYYQVDVNVCQDKDEWDRVMFIHSYGDLGIILGLVARTHGFSLGTKGLRIISPKAFPDSSCPPLPSLHLSSSFPVIMPFFGLSYLEWERGFPDIDSVFGWVRSSPLFDARRFARIDPSGCRRDKERKGRSMYQEFLIYASKVAEEEDNVAYVRKDETTLLQESLDYFDKRAEFDAMVLAHGRRQRIKAKFSGTRIIEWTGLENGYEIGKIMQAMKARFSDDDIIAAEEGTLKESVLQVQRELGLVSPLGHVNAEHISVSEITSEFSEKAVTQPA